MRTRGRIDYVTVEQIASDTQVQAALVGMNLLLPFITCLSPILTNPARIMLFLSSMGLLERDSAQRDTYRKTSLTQAYLSETGLSQAVIHLYTIPILSRSQSTNH